MSIPREVSLHRSRTGYRLVQSPVRELERYRARSVLVSGEDLRRLQGVPLPIEAPALDIVAEAIPGAVSEVSCRRGNLEVTVLLDGDRNRLVAMVPNAGSGTSTYRAPLTSDGPATEIRILLDVASVEVFADTASVSALLPNGGQAWTVDLSSAAATSGLERIEVHALARQPAPPPPPG